MALYQRLYSKQNISEDEVGHNMSQPFLQWVHLCDNSKGSSGIHMDPLNPHFFPEILHNWVSIFRPWHKAKIVSLTIIKRLLHNQWEIFRILYKMEVRKRTIDLRPYFVVGFTYIGLKKIGQKYMESVPPIFNLESDPEDLPWIFWCCCVDLITNLNVPSCLAAVAWPNHRPSAVSPSRRGRCVLCLLHLLGYFRQHDGWLGWLPMSDPRGAGRLTPTSRDYFREITYFRGQCGCQYASTMDPLGYWICC